MYRCRVEGPGSPMAPKRSLAAIRADVASMGWLEDIFTSGEWDRCDVNRLLVAQGKL
jgi:hypothetical protein